MSAPDIAWLFSKAVAPVERAYMERETWSDVGNSVSFATITLHTKSLDAPAHGLTAVICFRCHQTYVDALPPRCDCGEMLSYHADDVVAAFHSGMSPSTSAISRSHTQSPGALRLVSADPWETRGVDSSGLPWPPWAIPPSIISGATVATSPYDITSPYVSHIMVAEPPPPPPIYLRDMSVETPNKDALLVMLLSIVMLGFLYFLRVILAL